MKTKPLAIPSSTLNQHLVALGKTGAGKSSTLRHLVEHLLSEKKRVCVIDPKGDWWGLKWSQDGQGEGFPIIAFGSFKEAKATDIPINEHSGKHVAELIAQGNRPCIIGFRGWMTQHMIRFWIDFASTLFNQNSGELYLVGDEFHNFAPKGKIMDPEAGKCLHWSNRLMAEGRGLGIVCLIASQRPQKVHNDTLTSCETLIALRVIHKADRDAVEDWIKGCGDISIGRNVLNSLAGLARGEAYVWSPEIGFGPERVKFPMFETYDSFAPPQLQKKLNLATWENVDLEGVKAKLANVIEEQKANDPAELKRTIAELKRKAIEAERSRPEPERRTVPVFDLDSRNALDRVEMACNKVIHNFREISNDLAEVRAKIGRLGQPYEGRLNPAPQRAYVHTPWTQKPLDGSAQEKNGTITGGLRRMMIALAQRSPLDKRKLAVRAGMSRNSGTFGTYLAKMRTSGWVTEGEPMSITQEGMKALGDFEPLPTGRDLQNYWLKELSGGGIERMLQALIKCYPDSLTKEELGQIANISHTSGTFGTYLSKLRSLELVKGERELMASEELFE
jgi:hypothetical protein